MPCICLMNQQELGCQISLKAFWICIKNHPLARVGPTLVTGVADDDPSSIVTYSQADPILV